MIGMSDSAPRLFLLVFGLPPLVHPDDPARAVLASMELVKAGGETIRGWRSHRIESVVDGSSNINLQKTIVTWDVLRG